MDVVYEDNHIIVVNKQSGEIVQGDKTGDRPLSEIVKDYIKERYQKPGAVFLGVVHRLDRPVSGLVVFARTSKALTRLNRMFAEGEVHKTYWAIVERPTFKNEERRMKNEEFLSVESVARNAATTVRSPNVQRSTFNVQRSTSNVDEWHLLEHWLVRNEQQNKSYAYDHEVPRSKLARLRYRLLACGEHYNLVEVELMTGRHHQIRCQLATLGTPIKGDLKYGARRSNPDGSISLCAHRITFVHPVSKQTIAIESPLPDDPLWSKLSKSL